ncbi:MAG TPA: GtrA family protein [Microlunatus sp.]
MKPVLSGMEKSARVSAAEHYSRLTIWLHDLLPRFLSWIPITWIGFAMIGLTGFGIDIGVLTLLHGGLNVAYPIAVTLGYTVASIANFILNRWLNFQVHGDIAKQSSKQLLVAASNYLIWILGFSTVLDVIGVQYQVARILAACVEGLYLYLMMRLWVFRGSTSSAQPEVVGTSPQKSITR